LYKYFCLVLTCFKCKDHIVNNVNVQARGHTMNHMNLYVLVEATLKSYIEVRNQKHWLLVIDVIGVSNMITSGRLDVVYHDSQSRLLIDRLTVTLSLINLD